MRCLPPVQDITRRREDMIVQHDSLKLELKRLTELAGARADEVFNLENRKNQLQLSMREREKEVRPLPNAIGCAIRVVSLPARE